MRKKLLTTFVALTMIVTSLFQGVTVLATTQDVQKDYEIYPLPHQVNYNNGEYIIRPNVNAVIEENIDSATKNRLDEILSSKNKQVTKEPSKQEGKTNIYLGIYGSNKVVDQYVKNKYKFNKDIFTKEGAYFLASNNDEIVVLGKNSDAVFYGLTTLKHIFNQMDGSTIRNFEIEDYADTKIRGFIEGYYGVPWSNEDRMSLMKFGGDFKMTSYIFAPKDDPYHSAKWREPYPEAQLSEIQKMVEVGNASKCRFVWTIHPFMKGGITEETYETDIKKIEEKFEQLYKIGVRQFGVLGDDAGNLPREVVIRVMKDLHEWTESKQDVYELVFCPQGYNHSWQGDYSELNTYDAAFPEDIQIFWTGEAVCQPIEQKTLTHFRTENAPEGKKRRAPLFWLNWPVNDINMSRLMMGSGSLLHPNIEIEDLAGAVTNPMQDAEASKIAIFAVSDYAWNIKDFNHEQSWRDSFKYIEPNAEEDLYELAKHMSDPSPNGHGLVLPESEELKPELEKFITKLENNNLEQSDYDNLKSEFENIKKACQNFHIKSTNTKLKEELLPFTKSLSDQAESAIYYIDAQQAIVDGNISDAWSNYSKASSKLNESKNHMRKTLNGVKEALPGSKRITPFLTQLDKQISVKVSSMIDDTKLITQLITNRADMPEGSLEKLTDNNEKTEIVLKNPNSTKSGTYIGLSYNKPVHVTDVTFKMGRSGNLRDTFDQAKLQYTENGTDWIDIEGTSYTDTKAIVTKENLNLNVKGIRIISTADKDNMWLGCRDIIVNKDSYPKPDKPKEELKIDGTGIYNNENMTIRSGSVSMLTDGNLNDAVMFAKSPYEGSDKDQTMKDAWVGIEFAKEEKVNHIIIEQADNSAKGDHIDSGRLEYLNSNGEWILIKELSGMNMKVNVTFPEVSTKKIRLVNDTKKAIWWRVREISAYLGEETINPIYTISDNLNNIHEGNLNKVNDDNDDTFVWLKGPNNGNTKIGDYIEVDLGGEYYLKNIHFAMDLNGNDYWKNYDLEVSLNRVNYEKINSYDSRNFDLSLANKNTKARYVRIKNTSTTNCWIKIAEFNVVASKSIERNLQNIYTNLDLTNNLAIAVAKTNDSASLTNVNNITLKANQYIGIKLDRIKDISAIDVDKISGLQLQSSLNSIEWDNVDLSNLQDARYIRLINTTDNDVQVNLNKFVINSHELEPIHVENTNFANKESHLKVFDKDRSTEAVLEGSQIAGKYIVYDLGQTINLESLKLVLHDGTTDFPRHAKVSVSEDNQNWHEIMLIGNQDGDNPGEATNSDNINNYFPEHEISYNTKESTNLNKLVRYIKFEITRNKSGADKWVRLREIELNGGKVYLPTINDPTYETDVDDIFGGEYANMRDGNFGTSFIPSKESGNLVYHLSENNNVNKIKIVQGKEVISNAKVEARVKGSSEWINLGKLAQSVNDFILPEDTVILDIRLTWSGVVPNISELLFAKEKVSIVEKESLKKLTEENLVLNRYTKNSINVYVNALNNGKNVLESNFVGQESIDNAVKSILKAKQNLAVKGNIELLDKALQDAIKDKENYTAKSWRSYENALNLIKNAKENAENTSDKDVEKLLANLEDAKNKLVYNPSNMEESVLAVQAENNFIASVEKADLIYTENSWKAYKDAKNAVNALIEQNKESAVHPTEFKKALDSMKASKDALVNVSELKALIKEFEETNKSMYSKETFSKYEKAVNDSKSLLVNGTNENVAKAIAEINNAKKGLQLNTSLEALNKLIKEIEGLDASNYTKESFNTLNSVLNEVKNKDLANLTDKELNAEINKLSDTKNQLVSVEALKESLKVAHGLDKNLYTSSSYKNLEKLIADSQTLFNEGTKEEISKQISKIDQAIKGLVLRADENDVKEYLESIQLVDGSLYTKESYDAYMSAYNVLNKLASNLEDVPAETYLKAKETFERAKANLVKLTDKQPTDSNNGSNNGSSEKPSTGFSTNTALLWSVLLGAGAVLLLTLKRRNVETK